MEAPPTEPPDEGLGRYRLLRKLGEGGIGDVFLARDAEEGFDVVLRVLSPDLCRNEKKRDRFLGEARAAVEIRHPNLARIHDVGEANGRCYIASERLDGRSLEELLTERRLAPDEIVALALPLAEALAHAHSRGMLHRNVKPSNVVVTKEGTPKLLDLGLARLKEEARKGGFEESTVITLSGAVFGTPTAMSPEQALGRPIDERSDVFSFGSLLYEMATGRSPFAHGSLGEEIAAVIEAAPPPLDTVRRGLPTDLLAVVARAMQKDPQARYQHVSELATALRHLQQGTAPGTGRDKPGLWKRVRTLLGHR